MRLKSKPFPHQPNPPHASYTHPSYTHLHSHLSLWQVFKRLSNPLSWMDSFGSDGGGGGGGGGSGGVPSGGSFSSGGGSTPPIVSQQDDPSKAAAGGVLSSVFSMTSNVTSNVSNMLTRYCSAPLLPLGGAAGYRPPVVPQEVPPLFCPSLPILPQYNMSAIDYFYKVCIIILTLRPRLIVTCRN